MRISTILFIIALVLSTGDFIIATTTENKIIYHILQDIIWSCLGAGWALLFVGY